jgi:hypothetical protein
MDVPEVGPEQNSSWFSALAPRSITELAMDANMSGHQRKQALRVASRTAEVLEVAIEAEKPTTVTALADHDYVISPKLAKPLPRPSRQRVLPHPRHGQGPPGC